MIKAKILVIDDDRATLRLLSKMLRRHGHDCIAVDNPLTALEVVRDGQISVVVTDLMMPEMSGLQVLSEIRKTDTSLPVILITSNDELSPAVEAMKSGASDYIPKPVNEALLTAAVQRAIAKKRLMDENRHLKAKLDSYRSFQNIIGHSEAMNKIFATIERVARTNASVLIHGESGTGKEMVAHAIHQLSNRKEKPFIPVDCVSIPKELIESELFGYEKGAFTGAEGRREGLLSEANSGTFFFDEVTEIDFGVQAKLLRVLQERKFRRVGGRELLDVDLRIISATRRDPLDAVRQGYFREDLYYRLNVLPIELPPLRERREDIPLLVEAFMNDYRTEYDSDMDIAADALVKLQAYDWPGNVRELKNIVTRLCIMAGDQRIEVQDLPEDIVQYSSSSMTFEWLSNLKFKDAKEKWLQGFEVKYMEHILKRYKGNISEAARMSGVNRKTFQRLMSKHDIFFDRRN